MSQDKSEPDDTEEDTNNDRAERTAAATERALTLSEKRAMALELRLAGMTYADIAAEVGYSHASAARKAVQGEIAKVPREKASELKTMQLETLNVAKVSIFAQVRQGDTFAIDRLLKIMDHEAKLEGLYEIPDTSASVEVKVAFSGLMARARQDAQAIRAAQATDARDE